MIRLALLSLLVACGGPWLHPADDETGERFVTRYTIAPGCEDTSLEHSAPRRERRPIEIREVALELFSDGRARLSIGVVQSDGLPALRNEYFGTVSRGADSFTATLSGPHVPTVELPPYRIVCSRRSTAVREAGARFTPVCEYDEPARWDAPASEVSVWSCEDTSSWKLLEGLVFASAPLEYVTAECCVRRSSDYVGGLRWLNITPRRERDRIETDRFNDYAERPMYIPRRDPVITSL